MSVYTKRLRKGLKSNFQVYDLDTWLGHVVGNGSWKQREVGKSEVGSFLLKLKRA